jgi:hypothetical protein
MLAKQIQQVSNHKKKVQTCTRALEHLSATRRSRTELFYFFSPNFHIENPDRLTPMYIGG